MLSSLPLSLVYEILQPPTLPLHLQSLSKSHPFFEEMMYIVNHGKNQLTFGQKPISTLSY